MNLRLMASRVGVAPAHFVTLTIYGADSSLREVLEKSAREAFSDWGPATAFVEAKNLRPAGALVEVEAVGVISGVETREAAKEDPMKTVGFAPLFTLLVLVLLTSLAQAQDLGPNIRRISDGIYVYVGTNFNSNCGIVITQDGVVLIDSGHNPTILGQSWLP